MGYHKLDELQTAPDHTSLRVILRDSARAQKLLPAYDLRTLDSFIIHRWQAKGYCTGTGRLLVLVLSLVAGIVADLFNSGIGSECP